MKFWERCEEIIERGDITDDYLSIMEGIPDSDVRIACCSGLRFEYVSTCKVEEVRRRIPRLRREPLDRSRTRVERAAITRRQCANNGRRRAAWTKTIRRVYLVIQS
jgi:hypothetical protein